jgi:ADP-ribose pyrophosphatase
MDHRRRNTAVKRSQVVFKGKVFRVRHDQVVEPRLSGRGTRGPVVREVVEHRGSVVVLPVFADGRVLLVRQYRHAAGQALWELVAGHVEGGETPLQAARRELREESGYEARRFRRLLSFYPSPGFVTEKMHLYKATGLRFVGTSPEEDEELEVRVFTRKELKRILDRGRLRDGKTLVGVLLHLRGGMK